MSKAQKAPIQEKAMLANLHIGNWEGRRKDKNTGEKVISEARAEKDAGSWWTRIVPPRMLKDIGVSVSQGRGAHFRMTLPWSDIGPRILPAAMYMEYTAEMRRIKKGYRGAVEAFLAEYPHEVARAKERLGELYREEAYPEVDTLRKCFRWHVDILPIPDAGDFRVDLGAEETARIKENIERSVAATFNKAQEDLFQRMFQVVSRVAERLGDPEKIFRDSLIKGVVDLCDLLPKMNVTEDPRIDKLRDKVMKQIGTHTADDLRGDKTRRAKTADAAKKIMDDIKAFLPGSDD